MEKAECVLQTEVGRVCVEFGEPDKEGSLSLASTTASTGSLEQLYSTAARCLLRESYHVANRASENET